MPWYRRELNRSVQNLLEAGVTVLISRAVIVSRTRGGGFTGKGCVGHASSSGTLLAATGRSSTGKIGSPVTRFRTKSSPILVISATAGTVLFPRLSTTR